MRNNMRLSLWGLITLQQNLIDTHHSELVGLSWFFFVWPKSLWKGNWFIIDTILWTSIYLQRRKKTVFFFNFFSRFLSVALVLFILWLVNKPAKIVCTVYCKCQIYINYAKVMWTHAFFSLSLSLSSLLHFNWFQTNWFGLVFINSWVVWNYRA